MEKPHAATNIPKDNRNEQPALDLTTITTNINEIDTALRRRFPAFSELTHPAAVSLKTLQATLQPNENLLIQIIEESGSFLVFVNQTTLEAATVKLNTNQLNALVNTIRTTTDLSDTTYGEKPFDVVYAHELYKLFFQPFQHLLENTEHLVLVLDGAMQNLPPSLLVTQPDDTNPTSPIDYRNISFLGHEKALSVVPSVGSFVS